MSFLDELEAEAASKATTCRTCEWFLSLSPEEQKGFNIWLAQGRSRRGLWRACARAGLKCSDSSFREHLKNPEHNKRCQT